jgi:hypothetical protein
MCDDFKAAHATVSPLYIDYNGHWEPAGHTVVARRLLQAIRHYIRGVDPV